MACWTPGTSGFLSLLVTLACTGVPWGLATGSVPRAPSICVARASCFLPSVTRLDSSLLRAPTTLVLRAVLGWALGTDTTLVLMAGVKHCVAGITSSSSLSEEELLAVLSEAWAFLGVFVAWAGVGVAAGQAGLGRWHLLLTAF